MIRTPSYIQEHCSAVNLSGQDRVLSKTSNQAEQPVLQTKETQAPNDVDKVPAKIGRPTVMTPETCELICERLSNGETLSAICRDPKMPGRSTVTYYRAENSVFAERYTRARLAQMDTWADQTVEIADDGTTDYITRTGRNGVEYEAVDQEHIQRSRLRVDTRLRIMAVVAPHTYGEKVSHEHGGEVIHTVKISDRERMRRFVLFMLEDQASGATIEGELAGPQAESQPELQSLPPNTS